jgi:hypothetical protein
MRNKRGVELTLNTMIVAILLLVLLVIGVAMLTRSGKTQGAAYNELELKSKLSGCRASAALSEVVFDKDFSGAKGDGYPDSCDICLGGNDGQDTDADGVPDACDNDPCAKPERGVNLEEVCTKARGTWTESKQQCRLACYRGTAGCAQRSPAEYCPNI